MIDANPAMAGRAAAITTVLCELSAVPNRTIETPEQPLRVSENIGSEYAAQEDFSAPPGQPRLDCRGGIGSEKEVAARFSPALHSVRIVPHAERVRFEREATVREGRSDGYFYIGGLV